MLGNVYFIKKPTIVHCFYNISYRFLIIFFWKMTCKSYCRRRSMNRCCFSWIVHRPYYDKHKGTRKRTKSDFLEGKEVFFYNYLFSVYLKKCFFYLKSKSFSKRCTQVLYILFKAFSVLSHTNTSKGI